MRKAIVYWNRIPAADLVEEEDGTYLFRYRDDWFLDASKPSISLTLPKTSQEYRSPVMFPYFSNLVAEGFNHRIQEQYLKIDPRDVFSMLCRTAFADAIGAVTVQEVSLAT